MLAPELLERLALLHDPWQDHAPTLWLPWETPCRPDALRPGSMGPDSPAGHAMQQSPSGLPLHGVHEWVLQGPIDAPPLQAFLNLVAAACQRGHHDPASGPDARAASCVAWIGQAVVPSTVAMRRHGLDLGRQVLVPGARTPAERLWSFEEAARSGRCIAIVVDASAWSVAMVRRAQLASSWRADRTPVLALAWRPQAESTARSACTTRWSVQPMHDPAQRQARPAWCIQSVRDRRGALGGMPAHGSLHEPCRGETTMPWSVAS